MIKSPDSPITTQNEDSLGRWAFAKGIVDLIQKKSTNPSARIGIYGGWGTGKTSILELISTIAREREFYCTWFDPWKYQQRNDLWDAFIKVLTDVLPSEADPTSPKEPRLNSLPKRTWYKICRWFQKSKALETHPVSHLIKELVTLPSVHALQPKKAEIENTIKNAKRPIVIFIDDLDRTKPEFLPDIFMNLRSIFDIAGCTYILALDPLVVGSALATINEKWSDGYSFLEKIIEYPFWIPQPTRAQWQEMLSKETDRLNAEIDKDSLLRIIDLLPDNPRRLKLFLRHLEGLEIRTCRFAPHELALPTLYAAQLMKLEFPNIPPNLLQDDGLVDDIRSGRFGDRIRNDESAKKHEQNVKCSIDKITAPHDESTKKRFLQLYEGLKDISDLVDPLDLSSYFYFIEYDPILTWKELAAFVDSWKNSRDDKQKELISKYLTPHACGHLFKMLIEYRDRILGTAAESFTSEEVKEELSNSDVLFDILSAMVNTHKVFSGESPLLGPKDFFTLLSHVNRWAHFDKQEHYETRRQKERELTLQSINSAPEQHVDLLEQLVHDSTYWEEEENFKTFRQEVESILRETATKKLLNIFSTPSKFSELWGESKHIALKQLLLERGSIFHSTANRDLLKEVAKKSKNDTGIQHNFCHAFKMVAFYLSNPPSSLTRDDVLTIAKDTEFMQILWNAGTIRELNRRMAGSLKEHREVILACNEKKDFLPLPSWWSGVVDI